MDTRRRRRKVEERERKKKKKNLCVSCLQGRVATGSGSGAQGTGESREKNRAKKGEYSNQESCRVNEPSRNISFYEGGRGG